MSFLSGTLAANAAKSGAEGANAATREGIDLQRQQYNNSRQDFLPFLEPSERTLAALQSGLFGTTEKYGDPSWRELTSDEQFAANVKYLRNAHPNYFAGKDEEFIKQHIRNNPTDAPYNSGRKYYISPDGNQITDERPQVSINAPQFGDDTSYRTARNTAIDVEESAFGTAEAARRNAGVQTLSDLARLTTERDNAPKNFNYEVDPGFRFMQNEQSRILNQNLAGRGKYFSGRAVDETLGNANQRLIGNMYDTLYNRNLSEADSRYGRGVNLVGQRLNEANTQFGVQGDRYARRAGEAGNRYQLNLADLLRKQENLWNLVKTGQGAAGSIGTMGAQAANSQVGSLSNLASNSLFSGMTRANTIAGMGGNALNAIGTGMKVYDYGKNAGWWGGGGGGWSAAEWDKWNNS